MNKLAQFLFVAAITAWGSYAMALDHNLGLVSFSAPTVTAPVIQGYDASRPWQEWAPDFCPLGHNERGERILSRTYGTVSPESYGLTAPIASPNPTPVWMQPAPMAAMHQMMPAQSCPGGMCSFPGACGIGGCVGGSCSTGMCFGGACSSGGCSSCRSCGR